MNKNKIMIYILIIIVSCLGAVFIYMRHVTKKSPSIIGNDYDKELQEEMKNPDNK